MQVGESNYPISNVLSAMTCKVTLSGVRSSVLRLVFAKWIIQFAAHVAGMNCKVDVE